MVGGSAAHHPLEAFHRFEVVVEAHGPGGKHGRQPLPLGGDGRPFISKTAPEVWSEHFNADQGIASSNGGHGSRKQTGPVVGEVVAGDGGEHHITQAHGGNRRSNPFGFEAIEGRWGFPLLHLAKGTTAGANRTTQQKRGGACRVALAPVGAAALLANGVEPLLFNDPLHRLQGRSLANRPPEPGR